MTASRALLEHGLCGLILFDIRISPESQKQIDVLRADFPMAEIETREVNVTDESAVAYALGYAIEVLSSVSNLLCFASVVDCTHAIDMTAAQWRRVMNINLTGSFICAQACAQYMKEHGGGSITSIALISAHRVNLPQPQVSYNASKAGLLTLQNCLAAE